MKQVEPIFNNILRKTSILSILIWILLISIVFFVDFDFERHLNFEVYMIFFLIFAISYFIFLLVLQQAAHQSSKMMFIENEKIAIENQFSNTSSTLPVTMYHLKKGKNDGIFFTYHEGKMAVELDITTETVKGKLINEIMSKETFESIILPLERAFSGNNVEFQVRTDNHVYDHYAWPIYKPNSKIINEIRGYGIDVTLKDLTEKRMKSLTDYDQLTGLFNRKKYSQMVERFIKDIDQYKQISLMLIDLDDFKYVNDTLGHPVGDQLLIQVANRLKRLSLPEHYLFRLGGDEFAVLFTTSNSLEEINYNAKKIISGIRESIHVGSHQLNTTASIGISIYPDHANDAKALLKNADLAMYRAKNKGKNHYFIYSKDILLETIQRIEIQKALRTAIEKNEFILYYQPQIDSEHRRVVGVEALIRWHHPIKGFISPKDFIPIAEESGFILEIGEWVIRNACEQFRSWNKQGLKIPISVNLSAKQFRQENLVGMIQEILKETNMDPTYLSLEITESISMEDVQFTILILRELQSSGIKIAIDDFGTGYSSLSYLQQLPINCLKIDQSFIHEIESSNNKITLVKSIIDLAENLKFSVIAEGVEKMEQIKILEDLGCHQIQGFVYSPPVEAHEVFQFVKKVNEMTLKKVET